MKRVMRTRRGPRWVVSLILYEIELMGSGGRRTRRYVLPSYNIELAPVCSNKQRVALSDDADWPADRSRKSQKTVSAQFIRHG